ncbi:MAG: hypothetical protein LBG93_05760 [Treponema sp.]|jgi:hypothetical protein|nr:hypothetical protein [Treponema sp.]
MRKTHIFQAIFAMFFIFAFTGCPTSITDRPSPPRVDSIEVNADKTEALRGMRLYLSADVFGYLVGQEVLWDWVLPQVEEDSGAALQLHNDNNDDGHHEGLFRYFVEPGVLSLPLEFPYDKIIVRARSLQDPTVYGSLPLTVRTPDNRVHSVTVYPVADYYSEQIQIVRGEDLQFTAELDVNDYPDMTVNWTLEQGSVAVHSGTSISDDGLLVISSGQEFNGTIIVRASSAHAADVTDMVTVHIPAPVIQEVRIYFDADLNPWPRGTTEYFTSKVYGTGYPHQGVRWYIRSLSQPGPHDLMPPSGINAEGGLFVGMDQLQISVRVIAVSERLAAQYNIFPPSGKMFSVIPNNPDLVLWGQLQAILDQNPQYVTYVDKMFEPGFAF